jgi:hypothetical protein
MPHARYDRDDRGSRHRENDCTRPSDRRARRFRAEQVAENTTVLGLISVPFSGDYRLSHHPLSC